MIAEPNATDLEDDLDDGAEEPKAPVTPPTGTNDDLKAAMAELAGTVTKLAMPKAELEKELTQDQKDELWAVYNPKKDKPDFMRKFFRLNPEATLEEEKEAEDLFKSMQTGLMRQAVTGARNLMQIELAKRDEQLASLQEYVSKQNAEQTKSRFYSQYEGLSESRYAKVIAATAKELATQTFKDESSYFKALAEGAAETIKGIIPEFVLGAGQTNKNKSAGTSPRLPRTSAGGTGGAGGGGRSGGITAKGDATDDFLED